MSLALHPVLPLHSPVLCAPEGVCSTVEHLVSWSHGSGVGFLHGLCEQVSTWVTHTATRELPMAYLKGPWPEFGVDQELARPQGLGQRRPAAVRAPWTCLVWNGS